MAITYENQYHGYSILTDKERKLGCETGYLNKIERLTDYVTEKHGNTLCVRMDPRFPKDYDAPKDNKHIQKFISKHVKHFDRQGYDPHYVWVREQSREKHQHYHLAVFYKGCKGMRPGPFLEKADEHWDQTIGYKSPDGKPSGLVDHCNKDRDGNIQRNAYWLRRNDEKTFEKEKHACFERLSYFAKTNTKGYCPKRMRNISTSKMPKK